MLPLQYLQRPSRQAKQQLFCLRPVNTGVLTSVVLPELTGLLVGLKREAGPSQTRM